MRTTTTLIVLSLLVGCVTRVQVCTTYDRRLGRERPDVGQYGRSNMGASVCADVERPE
jgi:hypothetical protein